MALKRLENFRSKKYKEKTKNHSVHQKSTIDDMRARAEQLLSHSEFYDSMKQLEPFIKFASTHSFCDLDPEGTLLILHNCLVMRANKGYVSGPTEIVNGIQCILSDKKSTGYIMTRLENAANEISGEESIVLKRADRLVGFSLKKPKIEEPIRSRSHEVDRGPTKKDLERIASNDGSD